MFLNKRRGLGVRVGGAGLGCGSERWSTSLDTWELSSSTLMWTKTIMVSLGVRVRKIEAYKEKHTRTSPLEPDQCALACFPQCMFMPCYSFCVRKEIMELERCLQLRTHRGLAEDLSLAPSMHTWLTTPSPGDLMSFSDFFGLLHEHGTHKLSQAYIYTHKHT